MIAIDVGRSNVPDSAWPRVGPVFCMKPCWVNGTSHSQITVGVGSDAVTAQTNINTIIRNNLTRNAKQQYKPTGAFVFFYFTPIKTDYANANRCQTVLAVPVL